MTFNYRGETLKETWRAAGKVMPPTPANIRIVQRQMKLLNERIQHGTFDFADFFPDSPRATPTSDTFGEVADTWLRSKGQLKPGTKAQYANGVRLWKELIGVDRPMGAITYQFLSSIIGERQWPSAKTANNSIVSLRGPINFHYAGPKAAQNPMIGIKNLKWVRKPPDPFTAEERDLILADLVKHYDPRAEAYFRFAFYSGMRPEEIIALQWGDIDERRGTIHIQRVKTFKGAERDGDKTGDGHAVDLFDEALAAIAVIKPYTRMKSEYIFENPVTGKPWHSDKSQREEYFTPCLKRLGIRHRRAYNTRHTFATVALMAGVAPAYVAKQLGHVNSKMVHEVYSRWIDDADKGVQRRAMALAMAGSREISREIYR